jgi:hypothetical protein
MADLLALVPLKDAEAGAKLREKYQGDLERSAGKQKDVQNEARQLEREQEIERRRANRFDLGEVLLEVALVITSITLLTRRRGFWIFGTALGAIGVLITATGFVIH